MKLWTEGSSKREPKELTEKAMAVVGLWLAGIRDPREIADCLPGAGDSRDWYHVKRMLRSKDPVIRRVLAFGSPGVWAPIGKSIRCPGCGHKIKVLPCRICDANARRRCYSKPDSVEGKQPERPTAALPGTPRKLRVLKEREDKGLALWHPLDAKWPPGSPCSVVNRGDPLLP